MRIAKLISQLHRGVAFDSLPLGLLLIVFAAAAALMPAQSDTFWHLRAGADIWRTGHVPRVDSYSHTFPGAPWPDHEWLAQALMFAIHRLGGMPALTLAAALAVWASIAIVHGLMVGPPRARTLPLTLGLMIGCCVWSLRPQVLTLLGLAVLARLLVRERLRFVPILFLVWANAHGGVVLGVLVLVAAWAAAALRWWRSRSSEDGRRLRALSLTVPLVGLATAMTPLGFGIYRFVLTSTDRLYTVEISEWLPTWPTDVVGVLFWASALAFLVALIVRRRELAAGDWPDWVLVAGALVLAPVAFRSSRNVGPFVVLAIPAASRLLGPGFGKRSSGPTSADHPIVNLALLAATGLAAIVFVVVAYGRPAARLGWHPIPDGALRAVESCRGPLFNHYNTGGYLIWFTPDRPVFVDSRQDPYPVAFMLANTELERERTSYRGVFARWGIRCAFVAATSPIARDLTADGWQRSFVDRDWAVYAAPTGLRYDHD
jgi:hypothetical protein